MANYSITTLPITDKHLSELFSEIEKISKCQSKLNVIGSNKEFLLTDNTIKSLLKLNSYFMRQLSLSGHHYSISYQPQKQGGGAHPEQHPFFSTITIYTNENPQPDQELVISIVQIIQSFLVKSKLLPGRFDEASNASINGVAATLSAIQIAAADQVTRVDEFFANLVIRFDEKHKAMDAEMQAQRERLTSEFFQKEEALKAERDALGERRKQLDDRDNTHARRATKLELLNTLQKRQESFSISEDTKTLRWPIHGIFLLLLAGTLAGTIWALYVWGTNPSAAWSDASTVTSAIKTVAFTFGFLTSAGLYISWMNRWFDKHANAQFATKQHEIDINRATWAVEAALEWQRSQGGEMPPALINGITNNLFIQEKGESAEYSPLEALATSLLGAASNLKLSANGSELNFDRKSLKAMK